MGREETSTLALHALQKKKNKVKQGRNAAEKEE